MQVGPWGASSGSCSGAPTIAPACALVTRLHGVNRLRGLLPWRSTSFW